MTFLINDITIQAYRGINNLLLKELGAVNLLIGVNNAGKTSVLEAVELICSPLDFDILNDIDERRADPSSVENKFNSMVTFFPLKSSLQENIFNKISIEASLQNKPFSFSIKCDGKKEISFHDLPDHIKKHLEFEEKLEEKMDKLFSESELNSFGVKAFKKKNKYLSSKKDLKNFQMIFNYNINDSEHLFFDQSFIEDKFYMYGILEKNMLSTKRKSDIDLENKKINFNQNIASMFIAPSQGLPRLLTPEELTNIIQAGYRDKLIQILQRLDKNITFIETLPSKGSDIFSHDDIKIHHKKKGIVPISFFGKGIEKALALALAAINCKNGVLLIDEFETSLHKRVLKDIYSFIFQACTEFNVQLFLSTHSLEAIDVIIEVMSKEDKLSHLVAYRLAEKNDTSFVTRFSGNELFDLRRQLGQDLRW